MRLAIDNTNRKKTDLSGGCWLIVPNGNDTWLPDRGDFTTLIPLAKVVPLTRNVSSEMTTTDQRAKADGER
jgi:hypothetical protein